MATGLYTHITNFQYVNGDGTTTTSPTSTSSTSTTPTTDTSGTVEVVQTKTVATFADLTNEVSSLGSIITPLEYIVLADESRDGLIQKYLYYGSTLKYIPTIQFDANVLEP